MLTDAVCSGGAPGGQPQSDVGGSEPECQYGVGHRPVHRQLRRAQPLARLLLQALARAGAVRYRVTYMQTVLHICTTRVALM
eukprot:676525-Prorocentrum_minimum.AAC.1